jgi:hypothetical protein
MTPRTAERNNELSRSLRLLVGVGIVLVVVGIVLHLGAAAAFDASQRVGIPIDQRVALARRATRLVPWNRQYRKRLAFVETWKRADTALSAGDFNSSMVALRSIVGTTLAEPDLLALYHRAQEAQAEGTNWKAHVLHGREGPGGTLRPEDLLP